MYVYVLNLDEKLPVVWYGKLCVRVWMNSQGAAGETSETLLLLCLCCDEKMKWFSLKSQMLSSCYVLILKWMASSILRCLNRRKLHCNTIWCANRHAVGESVNAYRHAVVELTVDMVKRLSVLNRGVERMDRLVSWKIQNRFWFKPIFEKCSSNVSCVCRNCAWMVWHVFLPKTCQLKNQWLEFHLNMTVFLFWTFISTLSKSIGIPDYRARAHSPMARVLVQA